MSNAARILTVLDSLLTREASLIIYGRTAIALGFENPPPAALRSLDVDALLTTSYESAFADTPEFLLRLFRPAMIDLLLTKMMRGNDAQDMQDIDFRIHHDRLTGPQIEGAFRDAVNPDNQELRDAYSRAQPTVRALAAKARAENFSIHP